MLQCKFGLLGLLLLVKFLMKRRIGHLNVKLEVVALLILLCPFAYTKKPNFVCSTTKLLEQLARFCGSNVSGIGTLMWGIILSGV